MFTLWFYCNFFKYRVGSFATVSTIIKVFVKIPKEKIKKALYPWISMILFIIAEIQLYFYSSFRQYSTLYIIVTGFCFGLNASKLIISTMSGKKFIQPTLETVVFFTFVQIGFFVSSLEIVILIATAAFIIIYYSSFMYRVIVQLLRELNIPTF